MMFSYILSDRGIHFMSKIVSPLLALFQVKRLLRSSFHPQTNGIMAQCLRVIAENQDQWNEPLSIVKQAFRLLPIQTIPWKRNDLNN